MAAGARFVYDTGVTWVPYRFAAQDILSIRTPLESVGLGRIDDLPPFLPTEGGVQWVVYYPHVPAHYVHRANPDHAGNVHHIDPFAGEGAPVTSPLSFNEEGQLEDVVVLHPVEEEDVPEPHEEEKGSVEEETRVMADEENNNNVEKKDGEEKTKGTADGEENNNLEEGELTEKSPGGGDSRKVRMARAGEERSQTRKPYKRNKRCPVSRSCTSVDHVRRHVCDFHLPYWFNAMTVCFGCQKNLTTTSRLAKHDCGKKEVFTGKLEGRYGKAVRRLWDTIARVGEKKLEELQDEAARTTVDVQTCLDDFELVRVVGRQLGSAMANFGHWRVVADQVSRLRSGNRALVRSVTF